MNAKQRQKLEAKWSKQDYDYVSDAVKALLSLPNGRKMLWWLLQIGRVGGQPFQSNALLTAFSCGELNVGQQILDRIIEVNPAGYVQMMTEQANERSERDGRLNSGDGDDDGADEFGERDTSGD